MEILFFRFVIGYLALLAADRRPIKGAGRRRELTFVGAGLCGICLYYLMENIALTYTMASNVSVIVATAPFFYGVSFLAVYAVRGKAGGGVCPGLSGGHGRNRADQLQRCADAAESPGRRAGPGRRGGVGVLFRAVKEDGRLRLSPYCLHSACIFLWNPLYDSCSFPFWIPAWICPGLRIR